MAHENRTTLQLKGRYKFFYVLSLVALGCLLCANFSVIYTLVVRPPDNPEQVMKLVYLIMVVGFLVLAAQGLLVFTRFVAMIGKDCETLSNMGEQLGKLSVYDPLTKVYNRSKFEEVATRELGNVRRYSLPLSGIIFDVDNFKGINEANGYHTGDKLLGSLARYVSGKLRNTDYVFRWRGGKFIILAPHTDIDKAAIVAEKLRQIVGHKLFGGTIRMTLSLGVVQGAETDTVEIFIHRLQAALTAAKNQGRDRVVVVRT
jgi:diguanylate cyclase (GGDEF)-like protein